jgi:tRNA pseudouridine55 synthase
VQSRILLVDKPAGVTSHDVVSGIRREVGKGVRVGHSGTLDPFATGLLIVLVGRATRTQALFMGLPKVYETEVRFGVTSTTGDRDGELTATGNIPMGDLELPVGRIMQTPPRYSAIHVNGKRAHELARAGVEFELPEREIEVESFSELRRDGDLRQFRISCSSGTYIRSLVADLGDAYCEKLRRISCGSFEVPTTTRVELSLGAALSRLLPSCEVSEAAAVDLLHGKLVDLQTPEVPSQSQCRWFATSHGRPVAVIEPAADGLMRTVIGFADDYSAEI